MRQRYFSGQQQDNRVDNIWMGGIGAMLVLLFLFLLAAVRYPDYMELLILIYGILNITVFTAAYFLAARRVGDVLHRLGDMIECLIGGKEKLLFSTVEDTVLSKLQGQLLKLYDILCFHKENEQKLRRQLDENIGNLVHQLNTPVTNIGIYTDFMKRDDLTEEERMRFLSCMEEQAKKLNWLGEGFSRISRMETGIIRQRPEEQEILPVILQAVDQVSEKAGKKEMNIELTGQTHAFARLDRKWAAEAVFNVLDNAVKYGDRSSSIEIELMELTGYVRVAVRNYGIGVKTEEYHKIFKRFYRGKEAGNEEGVGLGLAIAREILEEGNGYIIVDMRPDGRTEFSLYFNKGYRKKLDE